MIDSVTHFADALEIGIVVLDRHSCIRHWNAWMAARSGHAADTVSGKPLAEVCTEISGSRLDEAIRYAIERKLPSLLSPALNGTLLRLYQKPEDRRLDARMKHLIHVIPLRDQPDTGACLLQISDMTAAVNRERVLRQQAENLRRVTTHDPLTNVANRRRFDEVLADEFAKARSKGTLLALVLADIDEFRLYAEHHGHEKADACLVEIGAALRDGTQARGAFVARYNSDQFAIILAGGDEHTACELAEDLRLRIATLNIPHVGTARHPGVTLSLGVAIAKPGESMEVDALLSSADVALYQARSEGRNLAVLFSLDSGGFRNCA